jgi:hypothetical protein
VWCTEDSKKRQSSWRQLQKLSLKLVVWYYNGDIYDMLTAWMRDNESNKWSVGIKFVQLQNNSALNIWIETTISVREAASKSVFIWRHHLLSQDPELWHRLLHSFTFFLHLHLLLEHLDLQEHFKNPCPPDKDWLRSCLTNTYGCFNSYIKCWIVSIVCAIILDPVIINDVFIF